jgi:hypothetical protein
MSSLTESSLLINNCDNLNKENNWYNNVYLCIEKTKYSDTINGFNCYNFSSIDEANKYSTNYLHIEKYRNTIIPVCKWIPAIFHKQYINYCLKKIYWKNNITIFKPKNKT